MKRLLRQAKQNGKTRGTRGFTLVEVIISVAALGLICAVLLRLFVLAGGTSEAAADRQAAQMLAASAMETLVCADTISDGLLALGAAGTGAGSYTVDTDGGRMHIRVEDAGGDYPGTLYAIRVQAGEVTDPVSLETKKYEPAAAAQCEGYAGSHP